MNVCLSIIYLFAHNHFRPIGLHFSRELRLLLYYLWIGHVKSKLWCSLSILDFFGQHLMENGRGKTCAPNSLELPNPTKKLACWVDHLGQLLILEIMFSRFSGVPPSLYLRPSKLEILLNTLIDSTK